MRVLLSLAASTIAATAATARADVTVYLDRHGEVRDDVTIPTFGGGDASWQGTVACVKDRFATFRVTVTDQRPASGRFITVVVGGKASLLGLDDRSTSGVGPYSGDLIPDAVVHVFSQVTGEHDVAQMCATAAHEVGHALGLDHSRKCGDLMSYYGDQCGTEKFLDVAAPCGESEDRDCEFNGPTQNSYRWLAQHVGLRAGAAPPPLPTRAPADDDDPADAPEDTTDTSDADDRTSDPADDGGSAQVQQPADPYADEDVTEDAPAPCSAPRLAPRVVAPARAHAPTRHARGHGHGHHHAHRADRRRAGR